MLQSSMINMCVERLTPDSIEAERRDFLGIDNRGIKWVLMKNGMVTCMRSTSSNRQFHRHARGHIYVVYTTAQTSAIIFLIAIYCFTYKNSVNIIIKVCWLYVDTTQSKQITIDLLYNQVTFVYLSSGLMVHFLCIPVYRPQMIFILL